MPGAHILASLELRNRKFKEAKIQRRYLRDSSNPMSISESAFIELFRINKEAFTMILNETAPLIENTSIPAKIQLAATLKFLAIGGFQGVVANDANISMARSTLSKVLWKVMDILEDKICPTWINIELNEDELKSSKSDFLEKYEIPEVIGCLGGTHIRIIKPSSNVSVYYNRKGSYSINVMIICDNKMRIRAVDGCRPGSCDDAFIWSMSDARAYYQENHENGTQTGWLLGQSGYDLEPFLLTPYRNPSLDSKQHLFNKKHKAARNILQTTINTLKLRFRCLQNPMLQYAPAKVVKLVNVCCALHNVCKHYNIDINVANSANFNVEDDNTDEEEECDDVESDEISYNQEASRIRDNIANSLSN